MEATAVLKPFSTNEDLKYDKFENKCFALCIFNKTWILSPVNNTSGITFLKNQYKNDEETKESIAE